MQCPKNDNWGRYLDGELSSTDRERFENHLMNCPVCERLIQQMRWEDDNISAALEAEPVPADLMTVINRRLDQSTSTDGSWIKLILPAMMLISALLALGLYWLPQLGRMRESWGQFLNRGLLVDGILLAVSIGKHLAYVALAGGPLLPTMVLLLVCAVWLIITIGKGRYVHV